MKEIRLKNREPEKLKVFLNDEDDYIIISPDDSAFLEKFTTGYKNIIELSEAASKAIDEIEKKYQDSEDVSESIKKTVEVSRVRVQFSEESIITIDKIFGPDTVKKAFWSSYEENPGFVPDEDSLFAFIEDIMPYIEDMYGQKFERMEKASKDRMAKYKPQDHKRPEK